MRPLKEYIKSVRPIASLFPPLLVLASYNLSTGNIGKGWLPALAIMVIYWATMAQNDLRDRWHDGKKGKTFALKNVVNFKRFVAFLWLASMGLAYLASCCHHAYILIFAFAIIGGLIYSELHAIPMASNITVALMTGSVIFFPCFAGHAWITPCLWLFVGVTSGMFAREILKDFDDRMIDTGYKWTFIERFGEERSKLVIITALGIGSGAFLMTNLASFPLVLFFMPYRPSFLQLKIEESEDEGKCAEETTQTKFLMDGGLAILMLLYIFSIGCWLPNSFVDKLSLGVLLMGIAFLVGSLPFSWLAVWWFGPRDELGRRQDLRLLGSGNVGATNAMRQLGLVWYPFLVMLDASKVVITIHLLGQLFPYNNEIFRIVLGLVATVGHCFPIYLGFNRGKGISCTLGLLVSSTAPILLLVFGGVWSLVILLAKKIEIKFDQRVWIGSLAAVASLPIFAWFLTHSEAITNLFAMQAILVIACHADHYSKYLEPWLQKFPKSYGLGIWVDLGFWLMDIIWKPQQKEVV